MTAPVRPFADPSPIGEAFVGSGPNAGHRVNILNAAGLTVPFGGFKQSGSGRDKSLHALDGYTQRKTTGLDLP